MLLAVIATVAILASGAVTAKAEAATFPIRTASVTKNFPAGSQGYVDWGGDCWFSTADHSGGFQLQAQMTEIGNSKVAAMRLRFGLAAPVAAAGPGTFRLGTADYQWLSSWPSTWKAETLVANSSASTSTPWLTATWTFGPHAFPSGYDEVRLVIKFNFDRRSPLLDSNLVKPVTRCHKA